MTRAFCDSKYFSIGFLFLFKNIGILLKTEDCEPNFLTKLFPISESAF